MTDWVFALFQIWVLVMAVLIIALVSFGAGYAAYLLVSILRGRP